MASGLPGKRVEAYRAGMIAAIFMSIVYSLISAFSGQQSAISF